jgi:hypothetical protein
MCNPYAVGIRVFYYSRGYPYPGLTKKEGKDVQKDNGVTDKPGNCR